MKIPQGKINLSFEFYAPRGSRGVERLINTYQTINAAQPEFVSLTLHAGGSTQAHVLSPEHRTTLDFFCSRQSPAPVAHISCVGKTQETVEAWLDKWWQQGVRGFVVLRGDNPNQAKDFVPYPKGFTSSLELIAFVRRKFGLAATIYVAAYPETHPEAKNADTDLDYLEKKIDAGADVAISQFFFSHDVFVDFLDKASRRGINIPIVPGILPVHDIDKVTRFAVQCGSKIPDSLRQAFTKFSGDKSAQRQVAVEHAVQMSKQLIADGVAHLHFYTLNLANLIPQILGDSGLLIGPEHNNRQGIDLPVHNSRDR